MTKEEADFRKEQLKRLQNQIDLALDFLAKGHPEGPLESNHHPAVLFVGDFVVVDNKRSSGWSV